MSVETEPSTANRKICTKCNMDVSNQRRFKDAAGHYYCVACASVGAKPEAMQHPDPAAIRSLGLNPRVICPHCWHTFVPHETMWVAAHNELMGDPVLGPEKARRFLPSRFTPEGHAIDARGVTCQQLACPRCHLGIPRSAIEAEPLFLSIVGGPKTGKSYLLSAMTWELRKRLPASFALAFSDADTVNNQHLNEDEATSSCPKIRKNWSRLRKLKKQATCTTRQILAATRSPFRGPFCSISGPRAITCMLPLAKN